MYTDNEEEAVSLLFDSHNNNDNCVSVLLNHGFDNYFISFYPPISYCCGCVGMHKKQE